SFFADTFNKLVRTVGKPALTARRFVLLNALWIPAAAARLMLEKGLVSELNFTEFFSLLLLLYLFLFVRIYLNSSLEPTTIRVKLTLSTVTITLAVLGIVGF